MTKKPWCGLLGVLLAALTLCAPVAAAEEAAHPNTWIVLVGINNYNDKQIKPRPHAEDDVKALYNLFTSKDYLGVPADHIRLLLGGTDAKLKSESATKANILASLEWLASNAKRDDLVIFTFVGEGGPLGEKSERRCYFAKDTLFKDRNKTAVADGDIDDRLGKLKSRRFCAFIDIDFRGFKNDPKVIEATLGGSPYKEFLSDDGTEERAFRPGRVVFLATNGLSTSLDLKEQGLFTNALLTGLKGAADKDGYEPDGVVTVDELAKYLDKEIPELAKKYGKTPMEQAQHHFVLGDRSEGFVLTTNPAVAGKVEARLKKFDKLVKDKKLTDTLVTEGRQLLQRMPKLEAQQNLRKAYQKVADGKITVEELKKERDKIVASLKLDKDIAERFATKVYEGADMVAKDYVKKLNEGELVGWAIRGLYRKLGERLPTDLADRLDKVKTMKEKELRQLLIDAREKLGKREDLAGDKDIDLALQRMMGNLKDPYSTYIDPDTLERFKRGTEGSYIGVGVQIETDPETGMLKVRTPIWGGPAYKAGIRAGDLITEIIRDVDKDGKPLEKPDVISTKGLATGDAVKKILGKEGTPVKLKVKRPGADKPEVLELKRGKIEMETVLGFQRKSDDHWDFMIDPKTKIGYIRLTQFTRHSAADMTKAVEQLKKQGVKGLVLDLRFNPGGLLDQAYYISDLFIDDGLVVSIRPREGKERKLTGFSEGSVTDFPMVCMVNGGSASGSEIVSACLQDHKRAIIVGERSFGKGSVQNVIPFGGGEMKMTTASFWRPSGRNLNKSSTSGKEDEDWGVIPDKGFLLPLSRKERDDLEERQTETEVIYHKGATPKFSNPDFKDRQLDLALTYLRDQIKLAGRVPAKKAS